MAEGWEVFFDLVRQRNLPTTLMIGLVPGELDHPVFEEFSTDVRSFLLKAFEVGPFLPERINAGTLLASYLAVNNFRVFSRLPDTVTTAYPVYLLVLQNIWLAYNRLTRQPCIFSLSREPVVSLFLIDPLRVTLESLYTVKNLGVTGS